MTFQVARLDILHNTRWRGHEAEEDDSVLGLLSSLHHVFFFLLHMASNQKWPYMMRFICYLKEYCVSYQENLLIYSIKQRLGNILYLSQCATSNFLHCFPCVELDDTFDQSAVILPSKHTIINNYYPSVIKNSRPFQTIIVKSHHISKEVIFKWM